MGSATIYLLTGLLATYAIQQSLGKPDPGTPNCSNLPDGHKIPGKNPPNFFFCHGGKPIAMFCPPGFNFCYNGQAGVCSKYCTNVDPPTTQAPAGCETTTTTTTVTGGVSPTTTTESSNGGGGSGEDSSEESNEDSSEESNEDSGEKTKPTTEIVTSTTTPEPEITTTPEPEINQCEKKPFGTVFSANDPQDCSAFIICIRGKPVLTRCLFNLTFDKKWGICRKPACNK